MSMQFDSESKLLATGTRNGAINIYNWEYAELEKQICPVDEETEVIDARLTPVNFPATCLKWRPKNGFSRALPKLTASYGNGDVKCWDVESKELKYKISEGENIGIYSIDYNRSGNSLLTAGMDYTVRVYDENTLKMTHEFAPTLGSIVNHFNRVFCAKFGPEDDRMIYSGGADRMICVHDIRCKYSVRNIVGPYVLGDCIDVHDNMLLAGSYRSAECIEVWDIRNYDKLYTYDWDQSDYQLGGQVVSAKFMRDGKHSIIAASRIAGEVKCMDLLSGETFANISGYTSMIYSMDFSTNGR